MKLIFFKVDRGLCCFIRTPDDSRILMDCGRREKFSPAKYVYKNELTEQERDSDYKINFLTISHPHNDHIGDIENVHQMITPKTLLARKYDWDELKEEGQKYPALDHLALMKDKYKDPPQKPTTYGVKRTAYTPSMEEAKEINADPQHFVNNSSVLSTVECGGFKFLFTGDIESEMWEVLLGKKDFKDFIAGTNIVVAPHHGLKSSFCPKLYDHINPLINIVSEGYGHKIDPRYSQKKYYRGTTYQEETRYSFTTKLGAQFFEINEDGTWIIWQKLCD